MRKPKVYQTEMWQQATFTHRVGIVSERKDVYFPENKMTQSTDIYRYIVSSGIYDEETALYEESFKILAFNRANRIVGTTTISIGSVVGTVVCIRKIMQFALLLNASNIVISHNHPSGEMRPSQNDINITKKIKDGCQLMDIQLLDHIILSGDLKKFYSFSDEGMI